MTQQRDYDCAMYDVVMLPFSPLRVLCGLIKVASILRKLEASILSGSD